MVGENNMVRPETKDRYKPEVWACSCIVEGLGNYSALRWGVTYDK